MNTNSHTELLGRIEQLNDIGIALSAEKDTDRLMETILSGAKDITNADGGTLYIVREDGQLGFEVLLNTSLSLSFGGTSAAPVPFDPIPLDNGDGTPNNSTVAAHAAISRRTVNIADAYAAQGYDFSGTMAFDRKMRYRSQSFLTVPMMDHTGAVIGVLQLINEIDPATRDIVAFSDDDQHLVESLASQAATALTKQRLIDELRALLEKFIEVIALAIDEKSPYTGGHCRRVPELAMMLTEAACTTRSGALADFQLSESERYEMRIAGLLHDCGKIVTPVHVVDKATKLETIYDRIHLLETRFEVVKRDALVRLQQRQIESLRTGEPDCCAVAEQEYREFLQRVESDRAFLKHCNIGKEFMAEEHKERVRKIAQDYRWAAPDGQEIPLLSEDEVHNLCIPRGTLTDEERKVVNYHIEMTIKMLESLPFPKPLRKVPEIAGGHHERMDGKGYPRGLNREQMSVQARIMGISDIFEALTARDRPYKKAMSLSTALTILGNMKLDGHIDPDLFDAFIRQRVYERYAQRFLDPAQIDAVDVSKIPGYSE